VSLNPPLISFSVMLESTTYPYIRQKGVFSINVLSQSQESVSDQFARRGEDKWIGVKWSHSRMGNPILDGSLMWLDCTLEEEHRVGDHYIVDGSVRETSPPGWHRGEPLVYFRRRYLRLKATTLVSDR
jgi:flavin reductase (DIM6/NTAB) family NADH-FMN oxidoreductase RutF